MTWDFKAHWWKLDIKTQPPTNNRLTSVSWILIPGVDDIGGVTSFIMHKIKIKKEQSYNSRGCVEVDHCLCQEEMPLNSFYCTVRQISCHCGWTDIAQMRSKNYTTCLLNSQTPLFKYLVLHYAVQLIVIKRISKRIMRHGISYMWVAQVTCTSKLIWR